MIRWCTSHDLNVGVSVTMTSVIRLCLTSWNFTTRDKIVFDILELYNFVDFQSLWILQDCKDGRWQSSHTFPWWGLYGVREVKFYKTDKYPWHVRRSSFTKRINIRGIRTRTHRSFVKTNGEFRSGCHGYLPIPIWTYDGWCSTTSFEPHPDTVYVCLL